MVKKIYKDIPATIQLEQLRKTVRMRDSKRITEDAQELIIKSNKIAKSKGLFFEADVQQNDDDSVLIGGFSFENKILVEMLKKTSKVYPYVVTCGVEIDDYAETVNDAMKKFILDGIQMLLVNNAKDFIANQIKKVYGYQMVKFYVPGATEEWPKDEQIKLFSLFGNESESIGVALSDAGFVLPRRSNIGIIIKAD